MPGKALPPYHIGEQHPVALLPPVADTLAELEERLIQYDDRLRLSDADRRQLEQARDVISDARGRLQAVLGQAGIR